MTKRLLTLYILFCSILVQAQSDSIPTDSYWFDGEEGIKISNVSIRTSLKDSRTPADTRDIMASIGGAIIFNNKLAVGGEVYAILDPEFIRGSIAYSSFDNSKYHLEVNMVYGGIFIEPYLFTSKYFNFSTPILFFEGLTLAKVVSKTWQEVPNELKEKYDREVRFRGIEPGINLEVNFFRRLGINLGGSYRTAYDITSPNYGLTKADFEGFNAHLGLRIYFYARQ